MLKAVKGLKKAFARLTDKTARAEYKRLTTAEMLWNKALTKAGMRYEAGRILAQRVSKNGDSGDKTRFSAKAEKTAYDFSKPFAEQVDDYKNGDFPQRDTFIVGATPKVYQNIGFNALPMTINRTHVDYALNGTKNTEHHIGEALLKQLPEALKNPVAVITSKTATNTSVVVLLEMQYNGNQVIAPVYLDGEGRQNGISIDSNVITSVHGRANAVTGLLKDALQTEANGSIGVFYWNKNKTAILMTTAGVTMPQGLSLGNGLIHSIRENGSPVKPKLKNITESQQFKRWFGKSKVVNADGTPKVVYHGTDAEFTVFESGHPRKNYPVGKNLGEGFYFTPNKNGAENYGKIIISAYVSIKNPYIQLGHEFDYQDLNALSQKAGREISKKNVVEYLAELGYDGIIAKSYDGKKINTIIAFYPTQIKSATDNIGTFDANNPDIRFSRRGATAKNTANNTQVNVYDKYRAQQEFDRIVDTVLGKDVRVKGKQNFVERYWKDLNSATPPRPPQSRGPPFTKNRDRRHGRYHT